jgi:hypothetical protein
MDGNRRKVWKGTSPQPNAIPPTEDLFSIIPFDVNGLPDPAFDSPGMPEFDTALAGPATAPSRAGPHAE